MKKITSTLLAVIMTLFVCLSATASFGAESSLPNYTPGDMIKIGVPIYDATDQTLLGCKEYFNYLSENFNVEFIYSEAISSPEDEISFIENCAVSGCQGILGFYDVLGASVIDVCAQNNLYFLGAPSDIGAMGGEAYEKYKDNPNWLGGVTTNSKNYLGAYAEAEYIDSIGIKKVIFASGGADFGVQIFVDLRNGFYDGLEAIGSDIEVVELSGFPGDDWFTQQATLLSDPSIEAVCGFGGLDYWAQPISAAGRSNDIILAVLGAMIDETQLNAMKDGLFSYCDIDNYFGIYALDLAFLMNALNGDIDVAKPDGNAKIVDATFWQIYDVSLFEAIYNDVAAGDWPTNAVDIHSMIKSENPDVTFEYIVELAGETDLNTIHERHAQQ